MKLSDNLRRRGWRKSILGDHIALSNGKGITSSQMEADKPIPVYGSGSIIGYTDKPLVFYDTIVIGRVGACGTVQIAKAPCWISDNAMYVTQIKPGLDFHFLFFLLNYLRLGTLASRTTQPSLPQGPILNHDFPLPPLPVQERIVEILQKADEIRRKRKEALELADKILPALFLEMFGDPATNPKGWPKLPLGKCTAIRRGLSKRPSPTGNVPIVRIKNLTLWGLDLSWSERVQASPQEIERGRLLPGDIVFSPLNGSISHLAKSDVFTVPETEIWVLDSNLCAFRVNESVVRNRFLAAFLALPSTLELFRRRLAVKTSGGQWLLKTSTLQGVEVPVPPLQLQDYFIQQVERHLDVRKKCTDALKESELCFASLLSQSFTGELTAEWEAANAEWIAERQAFYERLPRLVILALLAEKAKRAGRAAATVLITALMKYVFLFQMEGNGGRRRLYHFVPYHYGPFSKEVYADLEALEQEGLVRVEKDPEEEKTKITLADAAKIEERLAVLPDDIKQDVAVIIETYGDLDHATLLSTVYEKYPAYARKSQLKRKGRRAQ